MQDEDYIVTLPQPGKNNKNLVLFITVFGRRNTAMNHCPAKFWKR